MMPAGHCWCGKELTKAQREFCCLAHLANRPPTETQMEALQWIASHIEHRGWPPTMQELADYMGRSMSSAALYLKQLERKGAIRRLQKKWRGIRITEIGRKALAR